MDVYAKRDKLTTKMQDALRLRQVKRIAKRAIDRKAQVGKLIKDTYNFTDKIGKWAERAEPFAAGAVALTGGNPIADGMFGAISGVAEASRAKRLIEKQVKGFVKGDPSASYPKSGEHFGKKRRVITQEEPRLLLLNAPVNSMPEPVQSTAIIHA